MLKINDFKENSYFASDQVKFVKYFVGVLVPADFRFNASYIVSFKKR